LKQARTAPRTKIGRWSSVRCLLSCLYFLSPRHLQSIDPQNIIMIILRTQFCSAGLFWLLLMSTGWTWTAVGAARTKRTTLATTTTTTDDEDVTRRRRRRRLITHDADGTGVAGRYIVVLKSSSTLYRADSVSARIQDILDQITSTRSNSSNSSASSSSTMRLDHEFHLESFTGFTLAGADEATLESLLARDDVDFIEQVRACFFFFFLFLCELRSAISVGPAVHETEKGTLARLTYSISRIKWSRATSSSTLNHLSTISSRARIRLID
jgi:Peptidase inhibitor I9